MRFFVTWEGWGVYYVQRNWFTLAYSEFVYSVEQRRDSYYNVY